MGAVLFTVNLERIARFYEEVVGMRRLSAAGDHVVLEKSSFRLIVHLIPAHHAAGIVVSDPPQVRETSAIKLSFGIESLSQARELAKRLGGCVYARDREWAYQGTMVCDGWDPDGNEFQLFEPS